MYWPLGAPRSYAASQKVPSQERSGEVNEQHVKSTTNGGHDSDSVTSVAVPAESDARKDEGHDDNLIGVRLARGGSLFATWTACRVTFWQAKVSYDPLHTLLGLIVLSSRLSLWHQRSGRCNRSPLTVPMSVYCCDLTRPYSLFRLPKAISSPIR